MHEGHAADGRRDREVVCDADLRKIVRNSQIYATYVWTRPTATGCYTCEHVLPVSYTHLTLRSSLLDVREP